MKPKTALKPFALKAGGMTFEVRLPKTMTARDYEARYRAEVKTLRRYYCTLFAFWKSCGFRPEASVSRDKQFAARQRLLETTPAR